MISRTSIVFAAAVVFWQASSASAQNNQTQPGANYPATQQNPGQAQTGQPQPGAPARRLPSQVRRHLLKPGDAGYAKPVSKLPDDFPAPVYPKAVYDSANEVDGPGRQFYARFHVQADIDDVARWYQGTFKSGGWTVSSEPSKDCLDAIRLVATKAGHTGCAIRLMKQPDYVDPKKKPGTEAPKITQIGISVTLK
jgi:hypothetical protein